MVLDGMVRAIDRACHTDWQDRRTNQSQVHLIRYADDFIVTSSDRTILENKAKPAIKAFLKERGLKLSKESDFLHRICLSKKEWLFVESIPKKSIAKNH